MEIEVGKEIIIIMNSGLYAGPEENEEWTMRTGGSNGLEISMRLKNYSKWNPSTWN